MVFKGELKIELINCNAKKEVYTYNNINKQMNKMHFTGVFNSWRENLSTDLHPKIVISIWKKAQSFI